VAGISIDFALFPVDSIKTRIQASSKEVDFVKKAAHVNKYRGMLSAMLAAFPCSAIFWCTYELSKFELARVEGLGLSQQHVLAASVAEVTQALVRNPFEVVKQNMQIGQFGSIRESVSNIVQKKGFVGLYSGYFTLIMREIPFSAI